MLKLNLRNMRRTTTLAFSVLTLLGCTRTLYVPNAVNMPLFEHKGEYAGALNMRIIAPANFEIQGAYAPLDHLAVMANGGFMNFSNSRTQSDFRHHLIETGVGLFTAFGENDCKSKIFRAECFGGVGLGGADITDDGNSSIFANSPILNYDGKYHRKFLQLGIGTRTKFFDLSLGTRFASVNFSHYHDYENGVLTDKGSYNFSTIEPVAKLSLGYKQIKFTGQIGFVASLDKSGADFDAATGNAWGNIHFNGGVIIGTFHEKCPPTPTVSLGVAEPDDSIRYSQKYPPPPAILQLYTSSATICLQDGGSPDGDAISASFNGTFVLAETVLGKKPTCFDINLLPGAENILQIHGVSNGRRNPNTVKISLTEGKITQTYYLLTEAGRTEELRLMH